MGKENRRGKRELSQEGRNIVRRLTSELGHQVFEKDPALETLAQRVGYLYHDGKVSGITIKQAVTQLRRIENALLNTDHQGYQPRLPL